MLTHVERSNSLPSQGWCFTLSEVWGSPRSMHSRSNDMHDMNVPDGSMQCKEGIRAEKSRTSHKSSGVRVTIQI
jgi:hypothetical protein